MLVFYDSRESCKTFHHYRHRTRLHPVQYRLHRGTDRGNIVYTTSSQIQVLLNLICCIHRTTNLFDISIVSVFEIPKFNCIYILPCNCKVPQKNYVIQHNFFFHLNVFFYCITCIYIVQAFPFKIVSNIKD